MRLRVKFLFLLTLLCGGLYFEQINAQAAKESRETQETQEKQEALDFSDVEKLNAFWVSKPALQKEIRENRKLVVSVTEHQQSEWEFKGVGQIHAPLDSCWRQAYEVEKLGLVSKYIKKLSYDLKSGRLQFALSMLKKEIQIVAYLKYIPEHKKIHLSVLDGPYKGLRGVILFKDVERLKTESIFFAKYQKKSSLIPDWLFSFSIEAVMHQVASALREMVEYDHKVTGK